jgi:hypothetical protein
MKEMHRRYTLHDGTILSIQASDGHYSTPRNNIGPYTAAEVHVVLGIGPDDWGAYEDGEEGAYYGYVPIDLIEKFIADRGGIDLGIML